MKTNFLLFLCLFSVPYTIVTADEDLDISTTSQEQCFQMLKDDMTEAGIFYAPLQAIEELSYQELESNFSRFYANLSSFGNFEISQADVEMRMYSFGAQTGYKHPVLSPFPVSTKSEVWEESAKEFIFLEEYIVDPSGSSHFMDCGFISISSDRLAEVTRENYSHDMSTISLRKSAQDGSYKSWYSEILSYDRDDQPLVLWKRLFVYPKSTQNEYFNKYDVADAKLAHPVESFDVLEFFLQPVITLQDFDESGAMTQKTYTEDDAGELLEIIVPEVLQPVKREGINRSFSKSGYYNAIEAGFPEFAKLLSFRGSLQYETVKKILTEEQGPEIMEVFSAIYEYKELRNYYVAKIENESKGVIFNDAVKDKLLVDVANADEFVKATIAQESTPSAEELLHESVQKNSLAKIYIYVTLLLLLCGIGLVSVIAWKRRHAFGNDNVQ